MEHIIKEFCDKPSVKKYHKLPNYIKDNFLKIIFQQKNIKNKKVKKIVLRYFKEYSEKNFFKYIVRAQIPTSYLKQDSYFAKLNYSLGNFKKNQLVFVKGPFKDNIIFKIVQFFNKIKKILDLPSIQNIVIDLYKSNVKDFFNEHIKNVRTGIRHRLEDNKLYKFIIYENLLDLPIEDWAGNYEDIKKKEKKPASERWNKTNTKIIDWSKLETSSSGNYSHFNKQLLKNKKILIYYILYIFYREIHRFREIYKKVAFV